jgi:hypothetical protein
VTIALVGVTEPISHDVPVGAVEAVAVLGFIGHGLHHPSSKQRGDGDDSDDRDKPQTHTGPLSSPTIGR